MPSCPTCISDLQCILIFSVQKITPKKLQKNLDLKGMYTYIYIYIFFFVWILWMHQSFHIPLPSSKLPGNLNVIPLLFSKAFSSPAVPQVIHPETDTDKRCHRKLIPPVASYTFPHFPQQKNVQKAWNHHLETILIIWASKRKRVGEDCFFCVAYFWGGVLGELKQDSCQDGTRCSPVMLYGNCSAAGWYVPGVVCKGFYLKPSSLKTSDASYTNPIHFMEISPSEDMSNWPEIFDPPQSIPSIGIWKTWTLLATLFASNFNAKWH